MEGNTQRDLTGSSDARELLRRLLANPTCSVDDAAAAMGIARSTAYAAARDGSLPVLRISHRILVPTAKLCAMLGIEPGDVE